MHGEAERTDMVEFFAQQFQGFAFTTNGWVQVSKTFTKTFPKRKRISPVDDAQ